MLSIYRYARPWHLQRRQRRLISTIRVAMVNTKYVNIYIYFHDAKCRFLFWNDIWRNTPSHCRSFWMQFFITKVHFALRYVNSSYVWAHFLKNIFLFHSSAKSAFYLQLHRRKCLSIANVCELKRKFEIAWRYWNFFTTNRYGWMTKLHLKLLYVLDIRFCIDVPIVWLRVRALHSCAYRLIKDVCLAQLCLSFD